MAPTQYTFALDATATLFPRPTGSTPTRATKPQVLALVERLAAALRHPAEAAAL